MFDLVADVEKKYGIDSGYVYTLALRDNNKIKAFTTNGTEPLKGVVNASGNSIAYVGENVNTSDTKNSFSFVGEDSTAQDDGVDISIPGDADAPPAGSVRVGSDCHRQSFTTNPFDSLQIKSKRHPLGQYH